MVQTNGTATGSSHKLDWNTFHNTINGELTSTNKTRHGIDPSTEEDMPKVPVSTAEDVDKAVKAARAAFPAWRNLSQDERAAHIMKLYDAVKANSDGFKEILVRESGKPVGTAAIELEKTLGYFEKVSKLRLNDELVYEDDEKTATVRYIPLGVACAIVPWNWPLLLGIGKIVSALLAGNTLIVKPSPFTPYSALKIGELGIDIFPPGVLQVLSGGDDLGPMLTEKAGIDKISFTGSTFTGKKVMESCARTLKRCTLELGGNDPAIICADADIEKTIGTVGLLSFLSSGQICMDVKRIYVHEDIYDKFRDAMVQFASNIKTGPASDPDTLVGPIQNKMQYDKVQDMYSEIKKQGWNAVVGGAVTERNSFPKGYFMKPAIIDNPPEDSRIVVEEPFGPIVPLLKWTDEADVIRRANDTRQGLGASVWSKDVEKAKRIASQLEAGSVWVNTHFALDPTVPFGGMKDSGLGREWGLHGLKGWCDMQSFWVMK